MKFLEPTYYIDNVLMTDSGYFKSKNIGGIILDIDNTLISNTKDVADENIVNWINELISAGIKLCIVSNGRGKRVKKFNEKFDLPAVFEAMKPSKKGYVEALSILKTDPENTIGIGDQIFTDIWGANRAGINSLLVRPIDSHEQFTIKLKRILEKPIIRKLKNRGVIV